MVVFFCRLATFPASRDFLSYRSCYWKRLNQSLIVHKRSVTSDQDSLLAEKLAFAETDAETAFSLSRRGGAAKRPTPNIGDELLHQLFERKQPSSFQKDIFGSTKEPPSLSKQTRTQLFIFLYTSGFPTFQDHSALCVCGALQKTQLLLGSGYRLVCLGKAFWPLWPGCKPV